MDSIKLTLKDRRILDVLDKNPNTSLSDIARKTRISKQVAEYRIRKMLTQKTIYSFFTITNCGSLGHSLFRVHIKLKNISEERTTKFAEHLLQHYPTFWVGFISGNFDIIADIWAQNADEFEQLLGQLLQNNEGSIYSYEMFPLLSLTLYSYRYFIDKHSARRQSIIFKREEEKKIDAHDYNILQTIKSDSRLSYEKIGRKVRLSRNAVKYRIVQLEKKKVISGYQMMVDFRRFDRLSYKILIKYDHAQIHQEKELLEEIHNYSGVLAHAKLLGRWNLDIEIQPHDAKSLQKFVIGLRNKFSLIEEYELIQIIEDYGLDFFPKLLVRL